MTQSGNYFFIDGSALTAQIRLLRRHDKSFENRRLCPQRYTIYLMHSLRELHGSVYKRITFYFPVGDETAVEEYIVVPDHKRPGEVRDTNFKFCGKKLKKSAELALFVEEQVPDRFKDRFSKSEKGIDIEICCDALKLAAASRLERLFILTNDDDFLPLFRTIKEYGANISVIHLTDLLPPNVSLLREADSYDVVPLERLQELFLPLREAGVSEAESTPLADAPSALKPEAEPSDLEVGAAVEGEAETLDLEVDVPVEVEADRSSGEAVEGDDV